jgi:hypothetical protein
MNLTNNWTEDPNCPPDQIYMFSGARITGLCVPFGNEIAWDTPSAEDRAHATEQGWELVGWRPFSDTVLDTQLPLVWEPRGCNHYSPDEESAWTRLLESAMTGDRVAIDAMREVVGSNPSYAEFQDTLKALTK